MRGSKWEGRTFYANQMQMKAQKLLAWEHHFPDFGVRIGPLAGVLVPSGKEVGAAWW